MPVFPTSPIPITEFERERQRRRDEEQLRAEVEAIDTPTEEPRGGPIVPTTEFSMRRAEERAREELRESIQEEQETEAQRDSILTEEERRPGAPAFAELTEEGRLSERRVVLRDGDIVETEQVIPERLRRSVERGNVRPVTSAATGVPTPQPMVGPDDVPDSGRIRSFEDVTPFPTIIDPEGLDRLGAFSQESFESGLAEVRADRPVAATVFGLQAFSTGALESGGRLVNLLSGVNILNPGARGAQARQSLQETVEVLAPFEGGNFGFGVINPLNLISSGVERAPQAASNIRSAGEFAVESFEANPVGVLGGLAADTILGLGASRVAGRARQLEARFPDVVDVRTLDTPQDTSLRAFFEQSDDFASITGSGLVGGERAALRFFQRGEEAIGTLRVGRETLEIVPTDPGEALLRRFDAGGDLLEETRLVGIEQPTFNVDEVVDATTDLSREAETLGGVGFTQEFRDVTTFQTPDLDFRFQLFETGERQLVISRPRTLVRGLEITDEGGRVDRSVRELLDVEVGVGGPGDDVAAIFDIEDFRVSETFNPQVFELETRSTFEAQGEFEIFRLSAREEARARAALRGTGLDDIFIVDPQIRPSSVRVNIPELQPAGVGRISTGVEDVRNLVRASQPQRDALRPLTGVGTADFAGIGFRDVTDIRITANLRDATASNLDDDVTTALSQDITPTVTQTPRTGTVSSPIDDIVFSEPLQDVTRPAPPFDLGRPLNVPGTPTGLRPPRIPGFDFDIRDEFDFFVDLPSPRGLTPQRLDPRSDAFSRFFSFREFGRATDPDISVRDFEVDIFAGLIPTREQRRRDRDFLGGLL